jgi:hypothetical protein
MNVMNILNVYQSVSSQEITGNEELIVILKTVIDCEFQKKEII